MTAMTLEWLRCGVSVRKGFFVPMVSYSAVCVVVVTLCSFDVFSPILAPV
jgi:hypothetical protein